MVTGEVSAFSILRQEVL